MLHSDRSVPPAETVRRVSRHFEALGITRVARQTGLDRIGIPCFAAFRPNAATLSNSQGKGLDDDAARASAVMEAAEFAIAERADLPTETGTVAELRRAGRAVLDTRRLMPIGRAVPDGEPIAFVRGRHLMTGETVMVPFDAVTLDPQGERLPMMSRSTNGLASGNTEEEAVFHGLCELVERDATTLDRVQGAKGRRRHIDIRAVEHPAVRALIDRIAGCGFELWVFDQTSDIGVPALQAVIGDPSRGYTRHFDLATGYGCHPVAERALIRALTEAAQTRVTNIAGSRDDFVPEEYDTTIHASLLAGMANEDGAVVPLRPGAAAGMPLGSLLALVLDKLWGRGIRDVVVVPMGGGEYGFHTVKVFAPDLEDRAANRNWRPGRRYLQAMMRAS